MKLFYNPKLTLVIVSCLFATQLFSQQSLDNFDYSNKNYTYTIQLPNNFDPAKTYPVLVGPSEAKSATDESYYWQGTNNTQGWILVGYRIYRATNRVNEIKALFDHLRLKYKVENNKFHAVCFSANSASVFDLVMEMPEYFKGITGMAGNPNNSNSKKFNQLKGVKVQFIVGDRDTYWMRSAQKSHNLLLKQGVQSSIEIIPNGEHVMKLLIGKGFLERAKRLRD